MMKNTLYGSLLNSLYALDGLDGEFLGALAEPIRIDRGDWRHSFGRPVTLAVIPAKRLRRLAREVKSAEGRIARHRAHFAHLVREGKVNDTGGWTEGGTSSALAFERLQDLREELAEARADLAEALA